MKLKVHMFGVAKEIFGNRIVEVNVENAERLSVAELKSLLEKQKPALRDIGTYLIGTNSDYATDTDVIHETDEVAIIPPVAGG